MNDIIQTAQDKDYSSFSDEVKSILQDKLQDKLQEQGYGQTNESKKITINVEWTGNNPGPVNPRITMKQKGNRADLTGTPNDLRNFLLGPEYDLDRDRLNSLYPELNESESGDEYRAFFAKALKKFGVKSPDDLGDKEDEFFDYVKKNKPSK